MDGADFVTTVAVEALTSSAQVESHNISISTASHAQVAPIEELATEYSIGGLSTNYALDAASGAAPQVMHFQLFVGGPGDNLPGRGVHSEQVDGTTVYHAGLDALTRAHVDHVEFSIALASCENQIVRLLVITVQANLTDCSAVALHL